MKTPALCLFCSCHIALFQSRCLSPRHCAALIPKEVFPLLTYSLTSEDPRPLYEQLSAALRQDILAERLPAGGRLPSKRSLAGNLGVSSITVEAAYNRLIDEGFVTSVPKRGYFVAEFGGQTFPGASRPASVLPGPSAVRPGVAQSGFKEADVLGSVFSGPGSPPGGSTPAVPMLNLSASSAPAEHFPFSVWARLLRSTVNDLGPELLQTSPYGGVLPLREAIAEHLRSFRGMQVDSACIVVGAGTEYLYSLLIQLLGHGRIYCMEDPGYRKSAQIYRANGAECRWASLDHDGITVSGLEAVGAEVAHISPTHHFPTGITMPAGRRYELLRWAAAGENRWIIEDDYDSEFRLTGRPIPSLQSIDRNGKVIYMNTFSKTLTSTMRISYMVLPPELAARFARQLSFYSCTVSTFEQYTLAKFIRDGYFEKHLNRMRLFYARIRRQILQQIASSPVAGRIHVLERDSGLHFLLQFDTDLPDEALHTALLREGIILNPLSSYYLQPSEAPDHTFLLSYSSLSPEAVDSALAAFARIL